jgi:hypothetical protein
VITVKIDCDRCGENTKVIESADRDEFLEDISYELKGHHYPEGDLCMGCRAGLSRLRREIMLRQSKELADAVASYMRNE